MHYKIPKAWLAGLLVLGASNFSAKAADTFVPGFLKFEYWGNITGTAVQGLLDDARYPNTPDATLYMGRFDSRTVFPDDSHENYGARASGFLIPAETADYDFFISSDDASQLFLSSDDNPNNLVPIAEETGCCNAFLEPLDADGNPHTQTTAAPIHLVAGKKYAIQALLKEGGGGDYVQVAWRKAGDTTPAANLRPIPGDFLGVNGPNTGTASITQQPQSQTVAENAPVTFSINLSGSQPAPTGTVDAKMTNQLAIQWYRNGTVIPGANATNYTIALAKTTDNTVKFSAKVAALGQIATSSDAVLTVTPDVTAPTITKVFSSGGFTNVTVVFSEIVATNSAGLASNYTIDNGVTVQSAKIVNGTTVRLTTSAQAPNTAYNLTVNGVKDTAAAGGNSVAANTKVAFSSWKLATGALAVDRFFNVGGATLDTLLADPRYPTQPDDTVYWSNFGPFAAANNYGDNYGANITGWLIPPTTGLYKFYLRSDDASQLWLSTDETAANATAPIAEQTGCCNAFTDAEGTLSSSPVQLTAGKRYYVQALLKEGGGDDYLQVAWRTPSDPDLNDVTNLKPIPGQYLQTYVDPIANISVTQQPQSVTVAAGTPATFSVAYTADNTVYGNTASIQWQKTTPPGTTFADIPGATAASYTIPFTGPSDNGAMFHAVLSVGTLTNVTSANATLTLSNDTTPPSVTDVGGSVQNITVSFNEPVDAASAGTAGNYSVDGGVTVTGAAVVSSADAAGVVQLTISGAQAGKNYNVTVSNVKDRSGNALTTSVKLPFIAYNAFYNFNTGSAPTGTAIYGNAAVTTANGVGNSGALLLTPATGSMQGGFMIPDLVNGTAITTFTANFKLKIGEGSGNPADGFSVSIGSDLPDGSASEEGVGTGISVTFDTYDNGGGEAPAIGVKFGGTELATTNVAKATLVNDRYVDVTIQLNADGTLNVSHDGTTYFNKLDIGYAPISGGRFLFAARTGGEFESAYVDNLSLMVNAQATSLPQVGSFTPVTILGGNIVIAWTGGGTLQQATAVNGPWADVSGVTGTSLQVSTSSGGPLHFYRLRQ